MSSAEWVPDIEIRPQRRAVWAEIGEVWGYRELVFYLVVREIQARYRRTALGIAWLFIRPLLNTAIFVFLFGLVLRVHSDDLPYALFLPAFASVAQYHRKLAGAPGKTPEAARAAAEAFVAEEYLGALHTGARLDGRRRDRAIQRIAELSGLKPAFVAERNLRVSDHDFFFELLRDEGRIVGLF